MGVAVFDQQSIVLIGLEDLLAPPFGAQHEQADVLKQLGRREQGEQAGEQVAPQLAEQVGNLADLDTVAMQRRDQLFHVAIGRHQFVEALGTLNSRQHDV